VIGDDFWKLGIGCVAEEEAARVPTARTPGSERFLPAHNRDDAEDFARFINSVTNVLLTASPTCC